MDQPVPELYDPVRLGYGMAGIELADLVHGFANDAQLPLHRTLHQNVLGLAVKRGDLALLQKALDQINRMKDISIEAFQSIHHRSASYVRRYGAFSPGFARSAE